MSGISLSALGRSPAYILFNSVNLEAREGYRVIAAPAWDRVLSSMFGPVDAVKTDNVIKLAVRLWGAWENLTTIFPSYLMNPIPGTSIFAAAGSALEIIAANGDTLTLNNAAITGLANLYLGTDDTIFAADVEFTALLSPSTLPSASGAYTTFGTTTYSAATEAFAKTNFRRRRFTGAWGSITGFTAIAPQKGVQVAWEVDAKPVRVDGYGTVDMTVNSMIASCKCIPIGPTMAQIKSNSQEESEMGTLGSATSGDLVWTGANSGPVVTLKNAYLKSYGPVYDPNELRVGEVMWETTRGFSSGTAAVVASVA